eukprot:1085880-Karenia_brevis.AAC.1
MPKVPTVLTHTVPGRVRQTCHFWSGCQIRHLRCAFDTSAFKPSIVEDCDAARVSTSVFSAMVG